MDTEKKAKLNTNSNINALAIKKINISAFEKIPCRLSNSVSVLISQHTSMPSTWVVQKALLGGQGNEQAYYPLAATTFDYIFHEGGKLQIQDQLIIQTLF